MILVFDTSTPACTAALFDDGTLVAQADEAIGRGHAERLVPMIAGLLDGRVPGRVLVGTGPGSFTGIRVGLAAAHGLAIGWSAPLAGLSSLALIAASARDETPVAADAGEIAVAVSGGHGELFVQCFDRATLEPTSARLNAAPDVLARQVQPHLVVGSGAEALVAARGHGEARPALPRAAAALGLPEALRALEPRPVYARAPDAQPARRAPAMA